MQDSDNKSLKLPELHFTLYFDPKLHSLSAHVEKIIHLPTKRPKSSSDPFVVFYLLSRADDPFSTHMAMRTHSPIFDFMSTFRQISPEELSSQVLVFRVFINHENNFLGGVVYPLQDATFGSTVMAVISQFPEEESLKVC